MTRRTLVVLLATAATLTFASTASAAPYSISQAGGVLTVTMDANGGSVEVSACAVGFIFGDCDNYEIYAGEGFNGTAGCTDIDGDGGGIYRLRCNPRPTRTVINGSGEGDRVKGNCDIIGTGTTMTFNAGAGNDTYDGNCGGMIGELGSGNDTATVGRGTTNGGEGDDTIGPGFIFGDQGAGITLNGGPGRDKLTGGQLPDVLNGGPDSDRLEGHLQNDELRGDDGRDILAPGAGTDAVISGGAGVDTVTYEDVTSDQGVSLSINGVADDGAPGENDNIGMDIENIQGSPSPENATGSDGVNLIETDTGNDNVDPGKGNDFVSTGAGDDVVSARDGFLDAVDCGDGNDKVVSDEFDNVSNCETNDKSRELMSDVDNDGVAAPTDCDDRNPARRPGLPDKPGNKIDEDCSGKDAPFFRIVTGVQSLFRAGSTTTISRLNLVDVPAGATVEVRCKRGKKSCFKTKRTRTPKGAAQLNLRRKLKLARIKLRPGSVLEVRITNTDSIGKVVQYPIKRRRIPVSRLRCLPPGAKSPRRC